MACYDATNGNQGMSASETLVVCRKCGWFCVVEKLLADLTEDFGYECDECQQQAAAAK